MSGGSIFYHVWFSPRKRKWLLQGDIEAALRKSLQQVAKENEIRLVEYQLMVDHVHLLLELPPQISLSKAMNILKGVTARRLFLSFPELKLDAGIGHFWQKRYGYKEVTRASLPQVASYVRTQWERIDKFER